MPAQAALKGFPRRVPLTVKDAPGERYGGRTLGCHLATSHTQLEALEGSASLSQAL